MIILGIDPGIAIMGCGIVQYEGNHFNVIHYDAITTPSHMPTDERLEAIFLKLTACIETYRPDAIAVEELFFNTNAKTAILVGQARGVALLAGALKKIPLYEYTPLQVKQGVVGYGRADKKQVQQMIKILLNLETVPKPDDVADALAVAVCHAHSGNMQSLFRIK